MHAKEQRQEVEDSSLNFYTDCLFFVCIKQIDTKIIHKKSDYVYDYLLWCDILLIHIRRSSDPILSFKERSEVRVSYKTETKYLYKVGGVPAIKAAWVKVVQLKDSLAALHIQSELNPTLIQGTVVLLGILYSN